MYDPRCPYAGSVLTTEFPAGDSVIRVAPLGRHMRCDSEGNPVITRDDAFRPGGRHSRDLMNAPTKRFSVFAEAMKWFADDDTTTATDADTVH